MRHAFNALRIVVVIAFGLVAAASATAPGQHTVRATATVSASYSATWSAVIDLFAEKNWAIQNLEKDSGLITTDWMSVADDYADCGSAPLARNNGTQVRFNVRVTEDGETSDVSVNAVFRQHRSIDNNHVTVDCVSNGTVEAFIHHVVGRQAPNVDLKKAQKQERVKKQEAAMPLVFHCTSAPADPSIASCARSSAGCIKRQADIVTLVGDATPCVEHQGAVCFKGKSPDGSLIESCHPTFSTCEKQLDKTAGDAVVDLTACVAP